MKMTLLYIKETGHVMAAVTRVAPVQWAAVDPAAPGPSPEVRALVGDDLPVRSFDDATSQQLVPVALSVPAERLATWTGDLDEAQAGAPRLCQVAEGTKIKGPPARPVAAGHAVSGNASTVIVTLPVAAAAESVPIQVYVPAVGTLREQSFDDTFTPNTTTAGQLTFTLRAALPTGAHRILVLIKGQPATLHTKTVP
jgi:hypothetical protein